MGQSVPGRSGMDIGCGVVTRQGRGAPATVSRLSSSAPTHLGLDQIWQRREPRQHLLSTGSLAEAGSTSSLSTGGVLSPESHDFSHDEGFDSEDDSDHYEDFSSDEDGIYICLSFYVEISNRMMTKFFSASTTYHDNKTFPKKIHNFSISIFKAISLITFLSFRIHSLSFSGGDNYSHLISLRVLRELSSLLLICLLLDFHCLFILDIWYTHTIPPIFM